MLQKRSGVATAYQCSKVFLLMHLSTALTVGNRNCPMELNLEMVETVMVGESTMGKTHPGKLFQTFFKY